MPIYRTYRPVALITGASRGIGAATARELAQRGYALVLASRSLAELTSLAGLLTQQGCPTLPVPTDLCNNADLQRLAALALDYFGHVDVLVHNAGVAYADRYFRYMRPDRIDTVFETNLFAPITLTQALLPSMIERHYGSIIFVSSITGHIVLPTSSIYSASKFGLRGFAFGLRRELFKHNIGVSVISPGFIDTKMIKAMKHVPKAAPDLVAKAIADSIECPKREIFVPRSYKYAVWLESLIPAFFDVVSYFYRQKPK